jgi:peptidoglycan/LPS O-acetylase OafA/YrhL
MTAPNSAPRRHSRLLALDGLRGTITIVVVAVHLFVLPLTGGFVVMDVFFVMSGFLVTRSLLANRGPTGRPALRLFYRNRAVRLLPALCAALGFSAAVDLYAGLGVAKVVREAVLALTGTYNSFAYGLHPFGFDIATARLPQLWSLSVEEHAYLIVGILAFLFIGASTSLRHVRLALAITATLSAAAMVVQVHSLAPGILGAYYRSDARLFEVCLGALMAVAPQRAWSREKCTRVAAVAVGVFVVLIGVPALGPFFPFLVAISMSVTASVFLLLSLTRGDAGRVADVFRVPALCYVGRRSYAIYLLHITVKVVMRPSLPTLVNVALYAVVLLLAAEASYRLVERPVSRRFRAPTAMSAPTAAPAAVEPVDGGSSAQPSPALS